jgi:choline transporter-like protein 2/4/5
MFGKGFFTGAKNSFLLMMRNPVQFSVTHSLATAVLVLAKIAIGCLTSLFTYIVAAFTTSLSEGEVIESPLFLGVLSFIIGYIVGDIFMTVLQTAVETILQCFLIEMEMRRDNPDMPAFATKTLNRFIVENNRLEKLQKACPICCCLTCSCTTCCRTPQDDDELPPGAEVKNENL